MGKHTPRPGDYEATDPRKAYVCPACGRCIRAKFAEYGIRKSLLERIRTGRICGFDKEHICPSCEHRWSTPCLAAPMGPNLFCERHGGEGKGGHPRTNDKRINAYRDILKGYMDKVPAGLLDLLAQAVPETLDGQLELAYMRQAALQRRFHLGLVPQEHYDKGMHVLTQQIADLTERNLRVRAALAELGKTENGAMEALFDPAFPDAPPSFDETGESEGGE